MTVQDLFIGQFPGCLVIADKTRREWGDYKDIAHVSHAGRISWLEPRGILPTDVVELIEFHAGVKKIEWTQRIEQEIFYDPWRLYERMLDALPPTEFLAWCNRVRKPGQTPAEICRELLPIYERYA